MWSLLCRACCRVSSLFIALQPFTKCKYDSEWNLYLTAICFKRSIIPCTDKELRKNIWTREGGITCCNRSESLKCPALHPKKMGVYHSSRLSPSLSQKYNVFVFLFLPIYDPDCDWHCVVSILDMIIRCWSSQESTLV